MIILANDLVILADRPRLQDLQSFGTSDGKRIDMAEQIGPIGSKFGTCLLDDDDGVLFKNIESSKAHAGITGILNEVFYQFLAGRGKRPETWATFVNCLRVARLNFLADSIEAAYEQAKQLLSRQVSRIILQILSPNQYQLLLPHPVFRDQVSYLFKLIEVSPHNVYNLVIPCSYQILQVSCISLVSPQSQSKQTQFQIFIQ